MIVKATASTITNYDRNTFVAQATDLSEAIKNALNLSILLTLPTDKPKVTGRNLGSYGLRPYLPILCNYSDTINSQT
jgi:hypothetical protein